MLSEQNAHLQTGELKKLCLLFLPILLMTFSTAMPLFLEKIFLARISKEAMEIAVNAVYVAQIFQAPCVALAMMAQVFVGRWFGAKDYQAIGPGIWQFIWFSCLSLFITLPMGWIFSHYYFQGSSLETGGVSYCHFLIAINFLYPLGASLSCFYVGQGKAKIVLLATLGAQMIKAISAYFLIFGYGSWIPKLDLMGGAISTLIAQGSFCLFLLWDFLKPKYHVLFQSHVWHFRPKLFWECIHPGLLRASNRILSFTSWVCTAWITKAKGGDYLLSLSIGGALFLFLPFLGDALCQAQTTIVSQILGSKSYQFLNKALRSGLILVVIMSILVAIPLLVYPFATFEWLFPTITMDALSIQRNFLGIWICIAFFLFGFLPVSYVLAFKDTKFSLFMGAFSWINGFLFMYLALKKMSIEANMFWIVLSVTHIIGALFYWQRMRQLESKVISTQEMKVSTQI